MTKHHNEEKQVLLIEGMVFHDRGWFHQGFRDRFIKQTYVGE